MANVRNSVTLIGYLPDPEKMGRAIEYREGAGDKNSMFRGKISVRRAFKGKDDDTYRYDYISFLAWGPTADYIHNYIHGGDQFVITGEIRISDNYEKDGKTVYGQPYVHVDNVTNLMPRDSSGASHNGSNHSTTPAKKTASVHKMSPLDKIRARKAAAAG